MLEILKQHMDKFDEHYVTPDSDMDEYFEFSLFWQEALIDKSDYLMYAGNYRTCNYEFIHRFYKKIERHPILWRIFRRIFAV